jgi:hypothetical protein
MEGKTVPGGGKEKNQLSVLLAEGKLFAVLKDPAF